MAMEISLIVQTRVANIPLYFLLVVTVNNAGRKFMVYTILLADDSKTVQSVARILIEKDREFRLIFAKNGDEAVQIIRAQRPAAVLADHALPEKDGYEL